MFGISPPADKPQSPSARKRIAQAFQDLKEDCCGRNCSEYREQDIGWHNGSVYLSNVIIDKSASRTPQIQPRWA